MIISHERRRDMTSCSIAERATLDSYHSSMRWHQHSILAQRLADATYTMFHLCLSLHDHRMVKAKSVTHNRGKDMYRIKKKVQS